MPKSSSESGGRHPLVWKITAVAVLGSFLAQLAATIVNVSLSSLAEDLHSSLTAIQWVTSGYLLALALMLPLNGWLVERIGAKSLYLWCFSAFTLSSALCGLAWSANSLIAFRILQGMSGGLMAPMTQMMMARAAGKHMAHLMGYGCLFALVGIDAESRTDVVVYRHWQNRAVHHALVDSLEYVARIASRQRDLAPRKNAAISLTEGFQDVAAHER